ncbi:MAG: hypothetical protein U1E93_04535 [Alphaproteobacteria bacterium]
MTVLDLRIGAVERLSLPRILVVLGGFSALTAIFFWPWLAHVSTALIGPPEDNMQDFWNSWHAATARGWHDMLFTSHIRYPEGTSLAYHSFAWPQVFAVALLSKIFGGGFSTLVTLHNLTLLASFPLGAAAMFALARHLLGDVAGRDTGASVAGFVFAFNPWHVAQVMHHAHVSGIEFLPLFVLFYLKALEQRSWRWLIAAAVMDALSALSCWYFFFYAFYFLAFHLLYLRIHEKRWPRGWRLAAPALCATLATLMLTPWLLPMMTSGLKNSVYYVGNNMFVADLFAFFAFPPTHLLARYGSGLYAALTGNAWEATVYLGVINAAVAIWALTRKTQKTLLYYALGGMVFFAVIAGGETLHAAGHVTPLHLPGVILAKLPFFANVRTPARAMVMVYLFLGLILAQATVMALRYRKPVLLALAAALMLLDFTPTNLSATPATCPAALDAIAQDKDDFGVLDLPRGYGEGNAAMMASVCHAKPIVQGETARHMADTLADRLVTADLTTQRRQLAAAHVKYIVLHRPPARGSAPGPEAGLHNWNKADGNMADYARQYRAVHDDKDMTVLRVY